jgi:large subunit ribosomal protein L11
MINKIKTVIKLSLLAAKATPAPPVGPILGQHGINIASFCKEYNNRTKNDIGSTIPVEISIYTDRSYTFILKTPPVSKLLIKEANIVKGSNNPKALIVGSITKTQLEKIANIKLPDLNTLEIKEAIKVIEGTAKNMGIKILD